MKTIQLKIKGHVVLIDEEDYPLISLFTWHIKKIGNNIYAASSIFDEYEGMPKRISMHRLLGNIPKGMLTDHANGNGLDNRKCNIRACDYSQNAMNRKYKSKSGFIGVVSRSDSTGKSKHNAVIILKGKKYRLGAYDTAEEAAKVRDRAAIKYHGEFALLNFPEEVL